MRKSKRTTLRDIAEYTNVSLMTVSNVVNGKFEFVGDDTREKIQAAIKKLNYIPSATSRKLRSSQEYSIGMVIMDDEPTFLVNPFINHLVAGLSNYLSGNNYSLTVQGIPPDDFEISSIFSVAGTDALCAILCGSESARKKNIQFLLRLQQPVVIFQDTLVTHSNRTNIAVINQDDQHGGHLIASHVLSKGAKKLLFVQPLMEWPAVERRKAGIMTAVSESKNSSCEIVRCEESSFTAIQSAIHGYFSRSRQPDAILGATDDMGIAALRYCQDAGYSVPKEIMITGFNGFEARNYTNPSLTTVKSPAYEMGQYAGSLILNRLKSDRFSKKETLYPVSLLQGGSA